jgi:pyruvate formate lyase activating enzyme
MAFYRITYNEKHKFATLHNYGCTFRCPVCSYKLHTGADGVPGKHHSSPSKFLTINEMKNILEPLPLERLNFMGGEPSIAKELPEMLDFAKNTLAVKTFLGHTNGSGIPMKNLDGANVGLKAWDKKVHRDYTGKDKGAIFANFAKAFESGMELKANVVFIPGFVGLDQIEAIAEWISALNREIPFHIMGYIPVPGQPYTRPTAEQMEDAVNVCKKYLSHVKSSHLSPDDAKNIYAKEDLFKVSVLADTST